MLRRRSARFSRLRSEAARILNMADADAESHFVQDISATLEANTWRWTGKRPTIRLHPRYEAEAGVLIDFAIAGATFQQTGPVTLSFFVNEHLLDRVRYPRSGPAAASKSRFLQNGWTPTRRNARRRNR